MCWKMRNNSNFIQRWPKAIFTRSQQAACSYFTATHYKAACKSISINITSGEQLILGLDNCFKQSIDWKHRCPQLCFLLQPYQVSPITQGASSKQHHKWEEFEHLPLFISVPELLVWFLHIPPSFSSEHPHQRWGHLSCWTTKQLPPAAFPAGLTDLGHHSAKPEHGSAATASPLSQAATQCQAPRWPSCCESMCKTHSGLSGTHSSAARPTQCGCWGEQREELTEMMMGAVENNNSKRPSKQCTRFSAVLTCYDFSGFGFTSQVLSALGRKYPVQGPDQTHHCRPWCRWARLWRQSTEVSLILSLHTVPKMLMGLGFAGICYLQSREQREAGSTLWKHWGKQRPQHTQDVFALPVTMSDVYGCLFPQGFNVFQFREYLMLLLLADAAKSSICLHKNQVHFQAAFWFQGTYFLWEKQIILKAWKENKDKQMILKAGKGNKDNWWNVSFVFTQESWTHRII